MLTVSLKSPGTTTRKTWTDLWTSEYSVSEIQAQATKVWHHTVSMRLHPLILQNQRKVGGERKTKSEKERMLIQTQGVRQMLNYSLLICNNKIWTVKYGPIFLPEGQCTAISLSTTAITRLGARVRKIKHWASDTKEFRFVSYILSYFTTTIWCQPV